MFLKSNSITFFKNVKEKNKCMLISHVNNHFIM